MCRFIVLGVLRVHHVRPLAWNRKQGKYVFLEMQMHDAWPKRVFINYVIKMGVGIYLKKILEGLFSTMRSK